MDSVLDFLRFFISGLSCLRFNVPFNRGYMLGPFGYCSSDPFLMAGLFLYFFEDLVLLRYLFLSFSFDVVL